MREKVGVTRLGEEKSALKISRCGAGWQMIEKNDCSKGTVNDPLLKVPTPVVLRLRNTTFITAMLKSTH